MIPLAIIFLLLAIAYILAAIILFYLDNKCAFLAAVGFIVFLCLSGWSFIEATENTHTIDKVKSVQIDTVITTCKNASNLQESIDTTYVIKYTK